MSPETDPKPPLRDAAVVLIAAADPQVLALMRESMQLACPGVTLQLAVDAAQAQRLIPALRPDWLVLDLNLLDVLRAELDPAGKSRMRVVVIAGHSQDDRILPALRLGAAGFVMKRDSCEHIARELGQMVAGRPPELTQALASQILRELDWNGLGSTLTDLQLKLLTWLCAGDTPVEAAERMKVDRDELARCLSEIWSKTVYPRPRAPSAGGGAGT